MRKQCLNMFRNITEPIVRRVILLVVLFGVTISLALSQAQYRHMMLADLQTRLDNQHDRQMLTVLLRDYTGSVQDVLEHLAGQRLSSGYSTVDSGVRETIQKQMGDAEAVLNVLCDGGEYSSNVASEDSLQQSMNTIRYAVDPAFDSSADAAELRALVQLILEELDSKGNEESSLSNDQIVQLTDMMGLVRHHVSGIREAARIAYHHLDVEIEMASEKLHYATYLTAGLLILIWIGFITAIVHQVIKIVEERNTNYTELQIHRDKLDETIQRRVAEIEKLLRHNRLILDSVGEGVIGIDHTGRVTFANRNGAEMLGYSIQEMFFQPHHEIIRHVHADGSPLALDEYPSNLTLRNHATCTQVEMFIEKNDGSVFPVRLTAAPIRDEEESIGAVITFFDVSEINEAQRSIRENEQYLQIVFDTIQTGILLIDPENHVIVDANRTAVELIGKSRQKIVGNICHQFVCPAQLGNCPITDCNMSVDCSERVLIAAGGTHISVIKSVRPIQRQGKTYLLESFTDISHQKQAAEESRMARRAAEEANRAKSEFLANMSHEIRTPMTAILGFAEELRELTQNPTRPGAENFRSPIDTILRNGQYLLGIINDVLDLSKIEASRMDLEFINFSLVDLIRQIHNLMKTRAGDKGLTLHLKIDESAEEKLNGDPTRIRQILINLLGNAIKFTQSGSVTLKARCVPDVNKRKTKMVFDIIDTGVGMSRDQQVKIFQPFTQADASTTREYGGTGLGLTISRKLANMMGGDIEIVRSSLNEGTHFRVTLLATQAELRNYSPYSLPDSLFDASQGPKEKAADLKTLNCRILLVEDGPDNRTLISLILKKAGAQVEIEENGQSGMERALLEWNAGTPFDIILMDMQMPVMDGYTATSELRKVNYTRPIIALTANAMASDREKCLAAGCDDFTTKPIDRAELLNVLHGQLLRLAGDRSDHSMNSNNQAE